MKTPFDCDVRIGSENIPESVKKELDADRTPRFVWIQLQRPIQQIGREFSFLVIPLLLSHENELRPAGRGVLCQTESEARESHEILSHIANRPVVMLQSAGFGNVGRITQFRSFYRELSIRNFFEADGTQRWLALDREIDKVTGEITVIRRQEANSESEAKGVAMEWGKELDSEKRKHLEAVKKNSPPPPPPRCDPLTAIDMQQDIPAAKWEALKRRWPHVCEVFERRKANPSLELSDQSCQDAYILDLVEQGYNPGADFVRGELITALHSALKRFSRRKRSRPTDLV